MSQLSWARTQARGRLGPPSLLPSAAPGFSPSLDGRSAIFSGSTSPLLIGWSACLFLSCMAGLVGALMDRSLVIALVDGIPASAKMLPSPPPTPPASHTWHASFAFSFPSPQSKTYPGPVSQLSSLGVLSLAGGLLKSVVVGEFGRLRGHSGS